MHSNLKLQSTQTRWGTSSWHQCEGALTLVVVLGEIDKHNLANSQWYYKTVSGRVILKLRKLSN